MQRILCPFHKEDTPSFVVYPDGQGHCFGCGAHQYNAGTSRPAVQAEDLEKSMQYIDSLPVKLIRELYLPADEHFYYVVWPDKSFYIKRAIKDGNGPKYLSPVGHSRPPFILGSKEAKLCVMVEGEINALSLLMVETEAAIISLGSATAFTEGKMRLLKPSITPYKGFYAVFDNDPAGAIGAIETASYIRALERPCRIILQDRDFNEVLVQDGIEKLREIWQKELAVSP